LSCNVMQPRTRNRPRTGRTNCSWRSASVNGVSNGAAWQNDLVRLFVSRVVRRIVVKVSNCVHVRRGGTLFEILAFSLFLNCSLCQFKKGVWEEKVTCPGNPMSPHFCYSLWTPSIDPFISKSQWTAPLEFCSFPKKKYSRRHL
jgi:hypothetical protein